MTVTNENDTLNWSMGPYRAIEKLVRREGHEVALAWGPVPGGIDGVVVVRRLLRALTSGEAEMLTQRAQRLAKNTHPLLARILDTGWSGTVPYWTSEFVPGATLEEIISVAAEQKAKIPYGFSIAVLREVATALHALHTGSGDEPLLHGNVHPGSIVVGFDGKVALLLSGAAERAAIVAGTSKTLDYGKVRYASPEELKHEHLETRSDVYSAAIVLHELLTGQMLFDVLMPGDSASSRLYSPIPTPRERNDEIPEALSDAVMRALVRDRGRRVENAQKWASLIEGAGVALETTSERATRVQTLFPERRAQIEQLLSGPVRSVNPPRSLTQPGTLSVLAPAQVPPKKRSRMWMMWSAAAALLIAAGVMWAMVLGIGYHRVDMTGGMQPVAVPEQEPLAPLEVPVSHPPRKAAPSRTEPAPGGGTMAIALSNDVGTLTLITVPDAEVRLGKRVLGRTPLFNAQVAAGKQRLQLHLDNGEERVLNVTVKAGTNSAYRVDFRKTSSAEDTALPR